MDLLQDIHNKYLGNISVIIPIHNEKGNVGKILKDWSLTPWEIIVVDDGSTDGCCENLKGEPDVVLRRHDVALGESASRNEGAELFKGMDAHITFDSHERMDTAGGLEMLAQAAIATGGVTMESIPK